MKRFIFLVLVCLVLLAQQANGEDGRVSVFSEIIHDRLRDGQAEGAAALIQKRIEAGQELASDSLLSVLRALPAESESAASLLSLAEERLEHRQGLLARALAERAYQVYLAESTQQNPQSDHQASHALYERCHNLLMRDPPLRAVDKIVLWSQVGDSYRRVGMTKNAHSAFSRVLFYDYHLPRGLTKSQTRGEAARQHSRYEHAYKAALYGYIQINREDQYWLTALLNRVALRPPRSDLVPIIEAAIVAQERRSGLSPIERKAQLRERLIFLARSGHRPSIIALEDFLQGDSQVRGVLWSHVDEEDPLSSMTSLYSGTAAMILARHGEEQLVEAHFEGFLSDDPDRVDRSIRGLANLGTARAIKALFQRIEESELRPPRVITIEAESPDEESLRIEEPRLPVGLQIMQALSRSVEDPPVGPEIDPTWDHLEEWRAWYDKMNPE